MEVGRSCGTFGRINRSMQYQNIQFVPYLSTQHSPTAPNAAAFSGSSVHPGYQPADNTNFHHVVINFPPLNGQMGPDAAQHAMGSVFSAIMGGLGIGNMQDPLVRVLQASLNQGGRARKPSAAALNAVYHVCLQEGDCIECPISSESLNAGEWASRMPCGHYFSQTSLSKWLSEHNTCPVCRYELHTGIFANRY